MCVREMPCVRDDNELCVRDHIFVMLPGALWDYPIILSIYECRGAFYERLLLCRSMGCSIGLDHSFDIFVGKADAVCISVWFETARV